MCPMAYAAANDITGYEFGANGYTPPANHHYALHRATKLASPASATDTTIDVTDSGIAFPVNGIIGVGTGTSEAIRITGVSGTTLTLQAALANAYGTAGDGTFVLFDPHPDGSGWLELTGGSYARVSKANTSVNYDTPSSGDVDLLTEVLFPNPTANLGKATHLGVFQAGSGGLVRHWGRLANPVDVLSGGNPVRFPVGSLTHRGITILVSQ